MLSADNSKQGIAFSGRASPPIIKKATPDRDRFLKEAREGGIDRQGKLDAAPCRQSCLEKSVLLERNFHIEFRPLCYFGLCTFRASEPEFPEILRKSVTYSKQIVRLI